MPFSLRVSPILRSVLSVFAALAILSSGFGASARTKAKRTEDSRAAYRGAIVIDAASGNTLFEDQADEIGAPASMTKLMTYAVLHDKLRSGEITLETPVKIDVSDAKIGGTQVFLDPRETFTVEQLIYAMLIQSANDAAHALARVSAGSRDGFVALMNAKASELGMTHSTFRSPHGLPPSNRNLDGDLTTPRDYALLCRHLLLHTDVLKYTSVKQRDFRVPGEKAYINMINHNKLLGRVSGVDGLKTGYTEAAGYCLSATAERNGKRVIAVVMGSLGPGGERDRGTTCANKTSELIERGFTALATTSSNFAAERAKFARPAVIPLDGTAVPTSSATAPHPASGISSTPAPAAASPDGPSIKFSIPKK